MIKIGDFVTCDVTNNIGIRKGIASKIQNNRMVVIGVSGTKYVCYKDARIVPDHNLWGGALSFVNKFRKKHGIRPACGWQYKGRLLDK